MHRREHTASPEPIKPSLILTYLLWLCTALEPSPEFFFVTMSRPAKLTLAASVLVSGLTVWGVHYMQEREREVMYRGVERDEARQAEKRKRLLDLQINQQREAEYQKVQPTAASSSSSSGSAPS